MTSQIVILNGYGVALASDSVVTLGESRTYDTAEKVIPLPLPHRMAVLHSGAVRIGNLPYSVFVSEWVRQLGPKPLRNAESYQNSFQDWLANNQQWFSPDSEKNDVLRFIRSRAEAFAGRVANVRTENPDYRPDELLTTWTEEVAQVPKLESASTELALATFSKYKTEVDEICTEVLTGLNDGETFNADFISYCAEYFSSAWMAQATLTFAGYGEHDIYAAYSTVEFHGFVDQKLRWIKGDSWSLSPSDNPAFALAMPAQRDAIDQYLRGYDSEMIGEIDGQATDERYEILNAIRAKFDGDPDTQAKLDDAVHAVLGEFESRIWHVAHEFSEANYVRSLRWAIAALPAASLVEVARSLIELQALRKTTTAQQGTVGGPIDVALITPTDGFQWIRHKSIV
jgi:hypothetical protein